MFTGFEENELQRLIMESEKSTGVSVLTVVQIVLIILKLFKVINISWWLVFIPTYIGFGLVLIGLLAILCGLLIAKR